MRQNTVRSKMTCWLAWFVALSPLTGCISFPTISPAVSPFKIAGCEPPESAAPLVLALYINGGTLPLSNVGTSVFRIRHLAPDSKGFYRVPAEISSGMMGFFFRIPFFTAQAAPSIYVLLADGRQGSTDPSACKSGAVPQLCRSGDELVLSGQVETRPIPGSLRYLAIECLHEMQESEPRWRLLSMADAKAIGRFVLAHPELFDEVALAMWQRIALHAEEPIDDRARSWSNWVDRIWSDCPKTVEELRAVLPAEEQVQFFRDTSTSSGVEGG